MVYTIQCDFNATKNEVEYEALIVRMDMAHNLGATGLHVNIESLFVVNQMNGEFTAKDSKMKAYLKVAKTRYVSSTLRTITFDLDSMAFMRWGMVIVVTSEIIYDNGSQFITDRTRQFFKDRNIKLTNLTPRYPQSNGLAELSNKVIINSIKKRLKEATGKWAEELPIVLWANRTTPRTSTWQAPFSLVYGCEAILSVEAQLPTSRHTSVDHNLVDLSYDLDAVEELRESALIKMVSLRQSVVRHFNKNDKAKVFQEGDYVLRRVFQNTQEPSVGKLSIKWEGSYHISEVVGKGAYWLQTLDKQNVPRSWNVVHLKKYFF
ncbi:hypothetical protein L6452_09240 [Arctium lappa]|uniref:Uncharacterized protein n=1 Tax=Arctium lappa TaxID=4217 RepID=A0ACB9DJF4_ARCLA|nr:hypothetical protein L6452_09240 [Arctium lappa]